jgi:hypothetical protein
VDHDKPIAPPYLNGSTEAIHLVAVEARDTVESEEHDVAAGCPKGGIVKFTVARVGVSTVDEARRIYYHESRRRGDY